ncbi:MAG: SDR family oxidoreductase [Novosphingobium sp.]|uniref:SDR family oxidoreductase n=1 Tax=Novosphingobium sp. TaxID=1874826 RepID=UPI00273635C2|nr:SDR family oxidoreductase [Novosphingobium sp.]MDP3549316.1 SDR family oxidoreductase [Novosphingobium sp.]
MGSLDGKIAVVTGASAGIGEAIARRLAAAGATVVLAARREDRLAALAQQLGGKTGYFAIDLAVPDAPQALLDHVTAHYGTPDIVVHNAAVLHVGSIDEFDLAHLQPMIAINYESVVRSCYLFARAMKAAGRGHIVNISSLGANITAVGTGIYGGLKKALEMFTDALRIELAGTGVKVGLVAPGTTSTEIFEPMKADGKAAWDTYIPALDPDDIAGAVLFLLEQSPRANAARVHVYSAHEVF